MKTLHFRKDGTVLQPLLAKIQSPRSPGATLLHDFLEPLGLSISDFAARIGAPRLAVSEIVNEHRAVSPIMAIRLARALGTSPEYWLQLQTAADLDRARQSEEAQAIAVLAPIVRGAIVRKPPGPKPGSSPRRHRLS